MATARIISRSPQCSRELARELLARGYAVEIVSPDAVPDGLADLELRVEAGAGPQLTATVEAHNGGRSASLAFVHRLNAPIGDFVRRPPETCEAVYFPAQAVNFNAESGIAEDVEPPSENWRAPEPARKLEILPDPEAPRLEIRPDAEECARLITPPEQVPAPVRDLAKPVRSGVTIRFHRSKRLRKRFISSHVLKRVATQVWESAARQGRAATQVWESAAGKGRAATQVWGRAAGQVWGKAASQGRARFQSSLHYCRSMAGFSRKGFDRAFDLAFSHSAASRRTGIARSAGWFGRAAVIFAAVIVIAIVLGRGIGRGGAASVNQDLQAGSGQTLNMSDVNVLTNPEPEHAPAAVAVPTAASNSEAKPAPISKTPRVHTRSRKSRAPGSRGAGDDLVAHDTVTYFNKPGAVSPARDSSRRGASSRRQSGGAASASTSPM